MFIRFGIGAADRAVPLSNVMFRLDHPQVLSRVTLQSETVWMICALPANEE